MLSVFGIAALIIIGGEATGYGQYRPIAVLNNNGGNGHLRPTQYPSDSPNSPLDYEFSLNPNPSFRQQINSRRPIPPAQAMCMLKGKAFKSGAEVSKDECNTCKCEKGQWKCTDRECMSRCEVFGDPHYKTFDGKRYDFMGRCSYYFMKTDYGVDIIGENDDCPWGHTEQSCTKSVNIQVKHENAATMIGLKQDRRVEINGVDKTEELPFSILNDFITIRPASSTMLLVMFGDGLQLLWDGYTSAYIDAPAAIYSNKTNGLCGNMDGEPENDFQTPEGVNETSPDAFGNEWRVKEVCDIDKSTADIPHPCQGKLRIQRQSQQICSILQSQLFAGCDIDPTPYMENCLVDMCQCKGNPAKCMCTVFSAFANECSRSGNPVNWREFMPDCAIECPAGQVYEECSDKCFTSCTDLQSKKMKCNKNCVAGCRCPDGFALDENKQCIPIEACPKSENDDNNNNNSNNEDEDDNPNDYDQQDTNNNTPDYSDKDNEQPNENNHQKPIKSQKPKSQKPQQPKLPKLTPDYETEEPINSKEIEEPNEFSTLHTPQKSQNPQAPNNPQKPKKQQQSPQQKPQNSLNPVEPIESQNPQQSENKDESHNNPQTTPRLTMNKRRPSIHTSRPSLTVDIDNDEQRPDEDTSSVDEQDPLKDSKTPSNSRPQKPNNSRKQQQQRPQKQPNPLEPNEEDSKPIDQNSQEMPEPEDRQTPTKPMSNQRKPNKQTPPSDQKQPNDETNLPNENQSKINHHKPQQRKDSNPKRRPDEEQPDEEQPEEEQPDGEQSKQSCKANPMEDAETIGLVEVFSPQTGKCVNSRPIQGMNVCGGSCQSGTIFNRKTMKQDQKCGCCKPSKLEALEVAVECQDGSKQITQVPVPTECSCSNGCDGDDNNNNNNESANIQIENDDQEQRQAPNDEQLRLLFTIRDQLLNRRSFGY